MSSEKLMWLICVASSGFALFRICTKRSWWLCAMCALSTRPVFDVQWISHQKWVICLAQISFASKDRRASFEQTQIAIKAWLNHYWINIDWRKFWDLARSKFDSVSLIFFFIVKKEVLPAWDGMRIRGRKIDGNSRLHEMMGTHEMFTNRKNYAFVIKKEFAWCIYVF